LPLSAIRNLTAFALALAFVLLVLFFLWALPMRYDRILRRTNKYYAAGDVFREDGEWLRVIHVRPTTSAFAPRPGEAFSDVFCKKLSEGEAAIYEVMES